MELLLAFSVISTVCIGFCGWQCYNKGINTGIEQTLIVLEDEGVLTFTKED